VDLNMIANANYYLPHITVEVRTAGELYQAASNFPDQDEAISLYVSAAEQGDIDAIFFLMSRHGENIKTVINEQQTFDFCASAADLGNVRAQLLMGYFFLFGIGVEQDHSRGAAFFSLAAEQGDAEAQCTLGDCYQCGSGVDMDDTTAIKYFTLAANQGNADAQYNLGLCYRLGLGVDRNCNTAVEFLTSAAKQGNVDAQAELGYYYTYSDNKDPVKAVKYWKLSVDQESSSHITEDLKKNVQLLNKC
jgi:TPR repeat protein